MAEKRLPNDLTRPSVWLQKFSPNFEVQVPGEQFLLLTDCNWHQVASQKVSLAIIRLSGIGLIAEIKLSRIRRAADEVAERQYCQNGYFSWSVCVLLLVD